MLPSLRHAARCQQTRDSPVMSFSRPCLRSLGRLRNRRLFQVPSDAMSSNPLCDHAVQISYCLCEVCAHQGCHPPTLQLLSVQSGLKCVLKSKGYRGCFVYRICHDEQVADIAGGSNSDITVLPCQLSQLWQFRAQRTLHWDAPELSSNSATLLPVWPPILR